VRGAVKTLRSIVKQPSGLAGAIICGLFVLVAIFGPWLTPYDPLATAATNALAAPSPEHWLGTDQAGRDVLSRLIDATRPALLVGVSAVLFSAVLGGGLGILAGYYRGPADSIVMRVCDVLFAFPGILLGICIVVLLGPGIVPVALAAGISGVPLFARLARAEMLDKLGRDYVTAARGFGGGDGHVVLRHALPNMATMLSVQAAAELSSAVVFAATLDFIGFGTQPPSASWGSMLEMSRLYLAVAPIFAIAPGVVITLFVLGVNLLGAAVANSIDPRIRTRILNARRRVPGLRTRPRSAGGAL
jgi:ABC-type dipeptide/oligopeptide/nickel transport system permease subunit